LVESRITTVDVWQGGIRRIEAPARDPECPTCALGRFPFLEGSRREPVSLCGRNAVQVHERERRIDLRELAGRLQALGEVRVNEFALRFVAAPYEMTIFPDGRAIVKGTADTGLARSLYARYVG
jgi:adenylyltransferase/sulfurtransferase